jgi:hypothetical protein
LLVIRDYNQQMLRAPLGHLTIKALGHTAGAHNQNAVKRQSPADRFEVVNESQSITSGLFFDREVRYGLYHRKRILDMGQDSYDDATSGIVWGDERIWTVAYSFYVGVFLQNIAVTPLTSYRAISPLVHTHWLYNIQVNQDPPPLPYRSSDLDGSG